MTTFTLDEPVNLDDGIHVLGPAGGMQFLDYVGNPMAAGVRVQLYSPTAQQIPENVLATDWTRPNGLCPDLTPTAGTQYVAVFRGRQGPVVQVTFTGGVTAPTIVTVPQYQSPTLTTTNWALLQTLVLWNKSRIATWSDAARQPGGMAFALAAGIGAQVDLLDDPAQDFLSAARVQSSSGADIDSWFYDFLGYYVTRFPNQSDDAWRTLGMAILALQRNVIPSIEFMVKAYYAAIQGNFIPGPNLGSDTAGGSDTSGGSDHGFQNPSGSLANPTISVWDKMTQPHLAAIYGIAEPQFVIELGTPPSTRELLGSDTAGGSDTQGASERPLNPYTLTNGAPDPRLAALVNFVKAAGTQPMYLVWHS